ncbi:MAG: NupC/NupG family nucleoside CNT transporter [Deltaproteobacteria bacterium]|nr:NupC/NupG family nucleoside CNT transporter [Deltaproteobacteria bacterium]MBW2189182.1 NupC/NupG family nucleoside CNT transporter [Deltaproteobacteria bacterium]MBW2223721.1 NupC/NupG family nucleoside CNT transporter [Deltaproteobacteria bacterium]MBW2546011.1 NupC/NupG family nucleoside CNT transporter [Deltaproteobacteria bacterium]MBW2717413.1 NupC/NupG family nucleoside CNT transporter [Deltaproteobacteria bacterium]
MLSDVAAVPFWQRLISLFGLFAMVGIAWLLSKHRDRVPWRVIGWGIGLQVSFGVLVMKTDVGLRLFAVLNDLVIALLGFTAQGTEFIFGDFASEKFTIAINVLPTIIFFSSLMTILYHLGIMQRLVGVFAWVMRRTMRTSGSETLSAAANSFVGQTEAPLMIAPFIRTMTTSELMAVMTGGFATVAGGVLAAYVGLLKDVFPDIAGHLIAASVMSAPAALVIAKVMWPETETSETAGHMTLEMEKPDVNLIDAAARGAYEGMKLALNVGAMLLAFIALIALANALLGLPFELYNDWMGLEGAAAIEPLTMQKILGWIFWPFAFLIGVPFAECATIGTLLGEKLVLTEFVAYLHLYESLSDGVSQLSPRTVIIASYALCGFANFGSIGVQLGGIGSIAPGRKHDLARLGLRAMFGGMLASLMTAAVAGMLI